MAICKCRIQFFWENKIENCPPPNGEPLINKFKIKKWEKNAQISKISNNNGEINIDTGKIKESLETIILRYIQ